MSNIQAKRNVEIFFEDLPKGKVESWDALSKDAYGVSMTDGMELVSGTLTEDQARAWKEENDAFCKEFVNAVSLPVESAEVQELVRRFYQLSNVMLEGNKMGDLDYEKSLLIIDKLKNDPVMQEIYSFYHKDFARHLGEAMLYFVEHNLKDS